MRKFFSIFLTLLIVICFCSCSKANIDSKNNNKLNLNSTSNNVTKNISENRYKYINGYATFSCENKDGYTIFYDEEYSKDEEYTGKIRWNDEVGEKSIVSAAQVVSLNDKKLYDKELQIEDVRDETKGNHVWDFIVSYDPIVKVKCQSNENLKCYIQLVDGNNVEYQVMLTPVEKFNSNDYSNSVVYIIDKDLNKEFWYDDFINE